MREAKRSRRGIEGVCVALATLLFSGAAAPSTSSSESEFAVVDVFVTTATPFAAWQIELRKRHDDPLETDEVHLHLTAEPGVSESDLELAVSRRFHEVTEISPNELHFHPLADMREQLGIGRLLKEEKIADHRPKTANPHPALSS